jgi:hypothetical protein
MFLEALIVAARAFSRPTVVLLVLDRDGGAGGYRDNLFEETTSCDAFERST